MTSKLFGERMGDYLVNLGVVSAMQLEEGLLYAAERKIRLGEALVELGHVLPSGLLAAVAGYFSLPWTETIRAEDVDAEYMRILGGEKELVSMGAVPLRPSSEAFFEFPEGVEHAAGDCVVAVADPSRTDVLNRIYRNAGGGVSVVVAPEEKIRAVLSTEDLPEEKGGETGVVRRAFAAGLSPEQFMDNLLVFAVSRNCTDLHIEKMRRNEGILVRTRMNGFLEKYAASLSYNNAAYEELVAYIKVRAGLAPDQKLLPQDGGWRWNAGDTPVNIRVATLPTVFRYEKVSIRILDSNESVLLEKLGFNESRIELIDRALTKTSGLILVTGPTGSGKTTTLYGALSRIDASKRKIYTVEDPVEYILPAATQVQVNQAQGLTFARVLRSVMRHDPDVVFVGEIRDQETAMIALQFAMTGHLVLASMHTNDAAGAASRLVSLGAPPYMVAASLSLSVGQRLVRTNCPVCRKKTEPTRLERNVLRIPNSMECFDAAGCASCGWTGVSGRTSVAEFVDFSAYPDLEERMSERGWERALWKEELASGRTRSIYGETMAKVASGEASPSNAMMVARPGEFD